MFGACRACGWTEEHSLPEANAKLEKKKKKKKQRHKIIIQYPTSFYLLTVNVSSHTQPVKYKSLSPLRESMCSQWAEQMRA